MNSRERVLSAIQHEPVDRTPIDFGGHRSSGIMATAYARLRKYLGITSGNIYVYDLPQQLAIVEPVILDEFGVDVIELGRGFLLDDTEWKDWVLSDGTPCKIPRYIQVEERNGDWYLLAEDERPLAVRRRGNQFMEQTHFPMAECDLEHESFDDIAEQMKFTMWMGVPTPGGHLPMTPEGLQQLSVGAKRLRESTDRAIVGIFGGSLFEIPQYLFRTDNYLAYMALYPEAVLRLLQRLFEIHLASLQKWLSAVGPYIDIILFNDDFGTQNSLFFSPEMYRRYYQPFQRRLWQCVKQLGNVKIMLHSCGAIEPLLDDLIDAGVEVINPVQISCPGMEPASLKEKYGNRICFWGGGNDTRQVLSRLSAEEIAHHVRQQVAVMRRGSGFVFQQVDYILADVPPQSIVAMFKAVNS